MSLDVYLTIDGTLPSPESSGLFIRKNGVTREVSRKEWDEKFPGCGPVALISEQLSLEVFTANDGGEFYWISEWAGIYEVLWEPEESGVERAVQLIEPLKNALTRLRSNPEKFRSMNVLFPGRWDTYCEFVPWVEAYLQACEKWPQAKVSVWK